MKTKYRIFVSLPMYGLTDEDIRENMTYWYEQAKEFIKGRFDDDDLEFELIDTLVDSGPAIPTQRPRLWYLGRSIGLMASADYVIFAKGWQSAFGCTVENLICNLYDIPTIKIYDHI